MIKICLNTDVFKRYGLADALELTASAGYEYINLNAIPYWDPHIDFWAPDAEARVRELAELLDRHQLGIRVVESSSNLSAWDEKERTQAILYCRRTMAALAPLGCKILALSSTGTNLLGIPEQHRILRDSLSEISEMASCHDMTAVIEIYPGSCLEKTTETIQLLEALGAPNVGYNLCIPHVAALGEDLLESYRQSRPYFRHLHIADTPSSTVNHRHLVPGDGTADFAPLFRALIEDGYDDYATVQIYSCIDTAYESSVRALAVTRELLAEAVGLDGAGSR
jgi:fructoselysine 3-epimerase